MFDSENKPGARKGPRSNSRNDEPRGFYTTYIVEGRAILVGEILIVFRKVQPKGVIIAIKAPADQKIVKLGDNEA